MRLVGEKQPSATTATLFPSVESLQGSINDTIAPSLYTALHFDVLSERSLQRSMIYHLPKEKQEMAVHRYQQVQDYYKALRACSRAL